ncbi:MAG: PKD domain-containing protein [Actinobacteria bacterium]|nr:MAG: PKD domain-containing protein [Actinomycetota bacterium]
MSHRPFAAAGFAAAALFIAAVPAPAATVSPRATLATPNQTALLAARGAVVTVEAPRRSVARVALYARGHRISGTRRIRFRHATHVRRVLTLRGNGIDLLRRCSPIKLEVRMTLRRGSHTSTVRDRRALALDPRRCPAPAPAPQAQAPGDDHPAAPAPKQDRSLFKVGTAVVDISPTSPMPVGGYGANYIVTNGVHDPLQVRAFFVGHGKDAVTFVSVDSQGWFAAYQAPNEGDGADDARREAAAALAGRGYDVSASNVVVSATHDHAAPTIMGIWGHTDPAYLHAIKQAAVKAVLDAEAGARDAELWSATGTIKGLVSQVQGTDQMAGFAVDTELPILWAREPGTGATVATYMDVPTHVDQYNPISSPEHQFSADYPGYVRDRLKELLGGTSVVAESTLGRQESIGADSTYDEVGHQGRFITNQVMRALTHAHRIKDTTLAAASQPFSTQAENMGLLAAMSCNHPGGPLGCPGPLSEPAGNNGEGTWDWSAVGGIFTINRSLDAPWFTPVPAVGTTATVARVGDQVYATAPGEAFPEVTSAIKRAFDGSDGIRDSHIIDHAGDQLGYYWDQRPGVYPSAQLAQSDFQRFNVGSHLAQDNVDAVDAAGAALGLVPAAEHPYAEVDNPNAFAEPTIQFYSSRVETDDPAVSFYGTAKKAQAPGAPSTSIGSSAGTQGDAKIAWDFGDGTIETQSNQTRFTHTFPGPGTYRAQASVTDNLGKTYRWAQTVRIDAPLSAAVDQDTADGKVVLTARALGGQRFDVLAAHWTFSDGASAAGTSVTVPSGADHATVTIVDGAGNTATATVAIA